MATYTKYTVHLSFMETHRRKVHWDSKCFDTIKESVEWVFNRMNEDETCHATVEEDDEKFSVETYFFSSGVLPKSAEGYREISQDISDWLTGEMQQMQKIEMVFVHIVENNSENIYQTNVLIKINDGLAFSEIITGASFEAIAPKVKDYIDSRMRINIYYYMSDEEYAEIFPQKIEWEKKSKVIISKVLGDGDLYITRLFHRGGWEEKIAYNIGAALDVIIDYWQSDNPIFHSWSICVDTQGEYELIKYMKENDNYSAYIGRRA